MTAIGHGMQAMMLNRLQGDSDQAAVGYGHSLHQDALDKAAVSFGEIRLQLIVLP